MKPVVLLSAPYMLIRRMEFKSFLEDLGFDVIIPEVHERLNEAELSAFAGKIDATICGDDRYSPGILQQHSGRLKVISKWGTGVDSIDAVTADALNISVFRTPNAFTMPVADTVLGYILAFARNIPWADGEIKSGKWSKIPGHALHEKTLGVIGVGNIGKAVVRRARAFGMRCIGNDIAPVATDFVYENRLEMVSFTDLISEADYISLNCTLNETSRHIIDADAISLMKPSAVIINTARGPLIHEDDLIAGLQNKKISGVALDVMEIEPIPDTSPLLKMENVLLAPHNSNSSPTAWNFVHYNTIKNLLNGFGMGENFITFDQFESWMRTWKQ